MTPESIAAYILDEARKYATQAHEGARIVAGALAQTARLVRLTQAESAEQYDDRTDCLTAAGSTR